MQWLKKENLVPVHQPITKVPKIVQNWFCIQKKSDCRSVAWFESYNNSSDKENSGFLFQTPCIFRQQVPYKKPNWKNPKYISVLWGKPIGKFSESIDHKFLFRDQVRPSSHILSHRGSEGLKFNEDVRLIFSKYQNPNCALIYCI